MDVLAEPRELRDDRRVRARIGWVDRVGGNVAQTRLRCRMSGWAATGARRRVLDHGGGIPLEGWEMPMT
ncbi:hypothetical protein A0H81_14591 [Grifola frondosa]|uniref:Uncharacterized protein n=1 Tax=Grifola frondosa TaxID=5627 RepID=A0A1C7LKY7_GRIFR|nr:hypothetical protein A0H81_14591 [Grifola frondosa]